MNIFEFERLLLAEIDDNIATATDRERDLDGWSQVW